MKLPKRAAPSYAINLAGDSCRAAPATTVFAMHCSLAFAVQFSSSVNFFGDNLASCRNSSIPCQHESPQQRLSQESSLRLALLRRCSCCQITLTSCIYLTSWPLIQLPPLDNSLCQLFPQILFCRRKKNKGSQLTDIGWKM